jgi:hypothetical protein
MRRLIRFLPSTATPRGFRVPDVTIEIDPAPDDAEREAIVAALQAVGDIPPAYRSAWLLAALREATEPAEPRNGGLAVDFVTNHSN